jgi:PAS domain S-box-containing protein
VEGKVYRILLVEDIPSDAKLMERNLKSAGLDFITKRVEDEESFLNELKEFSPDIILSDYKLPVFDGLSALKCLLQFNPDIPFIFVSGSIGEEIAIQALKGGAKDYVFKDKMQKLAPAVLRAINEREEIHERQRAEEELRKSELKYRTLIERMNEGIVQVDVNNKILFVNDRICDMIGYNETDLYGKSAFEVFLDPDDQKAFLDKNNEILEGKSDRYEVRLKKKDGNFIAMEVSAAPIYGFNNDVIGSIGIYSDITERKEAEAALIEAKEKAEEMNKLKTSFLANMSHELRTPMIGILGFSQLLCDEIKDPALKENAKIIYESGKRLTETLNQILDLSRIESNKLVMNLTPINIIEILKESVKIFDTVIDKKKLAIELNLPDSEVSVNLDRRMFTIAIQNLINNAIKYTDTGKITVDLNEEMKDDLKWIVISINDTGIGISEKNLKLIFESFRQVSEGLNRKFEGVGLGLTITKKFVELMGGKIDVKSKVGSGSTFIIKFPLIVSNYNFENNMISAKGSGTNINKVENKREHKPEVLYVEDDLASQTVVSLFLHNLCNVSITSTGESAVQMAADKHYDLILMDVNLEGRMDGLETAKKITSIPGYKDIPIIAITAYAMVGDKEKFLAGGCTHYISKPFERSQIISMIKEILSI